MSGSSVIHCLGSKFHFFANQTSWPHFERTASGEAALVGRSSQTGCSKRPSLARDHQDFSWRLNTQFLCLVGLAEGLRFRLAASSAKLDRTLQAANTRGQVCYHPTTTVARAAGVVPYLLRTRAAFVCGPCNHQVHKNVEPSTVRLWATPPATRPAPAPRARSIGPRSCRTGLA